MSLTYAEMAALLGKTGYYSARTGDGAAKRELFFSIEVLDARNRYGSLDLLIRPVAGGGQTWVTASQVVWELPQEVIAP